MVSGMVEAVRSFGVFVMLDLGPTALLLFPEFEHLPRCEEDEPKLRDRLTAVVRIIEDDTRRIGLTQKPIDMPGPRGKHC